MDLRSHERENYKQDSKNHHSHDPTTVKDIYRTVWTTVPTTGKNNIQDGMDQHYHERDSFTQDTKGYQFPGQK